MDQSHIHLAVYISSLISSPKLIKHKGIINFGGKAMSVYNFAKKTKKDIKGVTTFKLLNKKIPLNHSMNLKKTNKILND